MKVKNYGLIFIIILFSFILSLNTFKVFSMDELSLFLTVIGLLYGLISAFTITNSWERFSKVRDFIAEETSSLMNAYLLAKTLSDKKHIEDFKIKIINYGKEVPTIEWKDYWGSEKTHKKFRDIVTSYAEFEIATSKDAVIYQCVGDEVKAASKTRTAQLVLSQTKISRLQWLLNIFLSGILLIGIIFLNIPTNAASSFIITSMLSAIIMILMVIYELDSMKIAEEEVSNRPYYALTELLENTDGKVEFEGTDRIGKRY